MNREDFRRWLLKQPARSIVGHAAVAGSCPLANWWAERSRRSCAVHTLSYRCPAWSEPRPLPEWAWHFALLLDHASLELDHAQVTVGRPVTREQALAVLVQMA